jgi:hypothetical protein
MILGMGKNNITNRWSLKKPFKRGYRPSEEGDEVVCEKLTISLTVAYTA